MPVALRAPTRRLHDQKLKNRRSLGAIAADIHNLQRKNVFAIGKLLLEAKEACDHGEWMPWLYDEFAWSEDSAQRFIGIARLGLKFRKLRNLKLAKTTLYKLADLAKAANETELAAIVPALAKHATRKHLKPADAAKIIELVQLRQRFGSYPQATLHALDEIVDRAESWRAKASEALMAERPTTEEAAEGIVMTIRRKHVADLYEQFGELPDLESNPIILDWLEDVPEQNREELMRRLLAEFAPITLEKVRAICWQVRANDDDDEDEDENAGEDAGEVNPDEQRPIHAGRFVPHAGGRFPMLGKPRNHPGAERQSSHRNVLLSVSRRQNAKPACQHQQRWQDSAALPCRVLAGGARRLVQGARTMNEAHKAD